MTVIIGENWAGKTARADAIRLLLVGYLPELGKTAAATWGLSSGREMRVEGIFDTGETIMRKWWISGDTVKSGFIVPPSLEQYAGISVMLNADDYFKKSDRERINYVFANIPMAAEQYSPIMIRESLRTLLSNPQGEEETVDHYKQEDVDKFLNELDERIEAGGGELIPQEFIESAIVQTAAIATRARDFVDQMQRTIQGLCYLRTQDQAGGASIASIEDQLALLTREITALTEKKGIFIGSYASIVNARERRKYLKKEIDCGAKISEEMENLRTELIHAENHKRIIEAPGLETLSKMNQDVELFRAAVVKSGENKKAAADRKFTRELELTELDGKTECPYCGATGEGWKKIRASELRLLIDDDAAKIAIFEKTIADSQESFVKAGVNFVLAKDNQANADAASVEIHRITQAIDKHETAIVRLHTLKAEFEQLTPEDPMLQQQVEQLQESLNVKNQALVSLKEVHRKVMARAGDLQRLAEAEKQRDEGQAELAIVILAAVELRKIQAKMVEDAFVPLLQSANDLFGGMLRTPLAYRDGDIGTWRGGLWYTHKTFSGTEKALTYAAIQIALSAKAPFGIMILDELGRISETKMALVYARIVQALNKKWIGQFIGIDAGRLAIHENAIEWHKDAMPAGSFKVVEII